MITLLSYEGSTREIFAIIIVGIGRFRAVFAVIKRTFMAV